MLRPLRTSLAAAALLAVCASGRAQSPAPHDASAPSPESAEAAPLTALAQGTRTVLLSNIPTAENLLFLSDGRLLVSGDRGLYLVGRDASGALTADNLQPSAPCAFGGIAEVRGTVYVNCYDFKRAFVYASALAPLAFTQAAEVTDTAIGNGMTSDGQHLYLSATLQSKIVRLTIDPSDPRKLTDQTTFAAAPDAPLPNGLEIFGDALYWTDGLAIKSAPLDRSAPPRTLAMRASLLDDLHVDARGVIACDFGSNVLVAFDSTGKQVAQTPAVFQSPSAVVPARGRLGFGANDLIVTERGGGVVSVYRPQ